MQQCNAMQCSNAMQCNELTAAAAAAAAAGWIGRAIEHMHKPGWLASQVMIIMMMRMTAWIEQEIMLYLAS